MKQIFFDQNQSVLIKVFPNSKLLDREICGAQSFANLVEVPKIEKLDSKVAKLSFMPGFLGYQIKEESLNFLIAQFLRNIKPVNKGKFSILEEIDSLVSFFAGDRQIVDELKKVKESIKGLAFFPVHGDLQKQNILVSEGKIGLIDFEHFTLAPRELEICNSIFFNDGNCLNIAHLLFLLPRGFIDKRILRLMLKFYSYKQIKLGTKKAHVNQRLAQALKKLGGSLFQGGASYGQH